VGDDAYVDIQDPVRLDDHSEPVPDAMIVRARDYRDELPTPQDVLLLIEVSDTSLGYDRGLKLSLYARAGIPEVWIVDLQGEQIVRHTSPSGSTYRSVVRTGRGEEVESLAVPGLVLRVDQVLP
jgi:Uma2 family endonuclease